MRIPVLRRWLALLLIAAIFGGSMARPAFAVGQEPCSMAMDQMAGQTAGMAAMESHHDAKPMPCKGMSPLCAADAGCLMVVGVPALPWLARTADPQWSLVSYWPSSPAARGLSIAPALGPPILQA